MNFTKPMLAASLLPSSVEHTDAKILEAMSKLRYPVLATIKKDGIRALRLNGTLLSRTLKPIPNKSIRERSLILPGGFDMELWNPELSYEEVESIVMSREHPRSDEIQFHVLDWFGKTDSMFLDTYQGRINNIHYWYEKERCCFGIGWSLPIFISRAELLMDYFKVIEQEGHEGICFRTPNSPYKQGRSTLKEQYLVKLCRFHTSECIIEGFLEQEENGNTCTRNATGMMDRSSHKSGKEGKNTLGALLVRDIHTGVEFKIGTGVGLDDRLRKEIWMNRPKYMSTVWMYKFKGGGKMKPRSPILKGQRKEIDIV